MLKNKTVRRLIDNFSSLMLLQIINNIIPLITFPYLVHILGIAQFGVFSFVMAIINYGVLITDYGFNLSATKHISIHVNDPKKINEIFSSVMVIKVLMMVLFFIFLMILITFVDKFSQYQSLYIYAFGLVIGQVLFPVWFFQGIEKMRYITILNAISKIIFAATIFIFVKDSNDFEMVFILNSLGSIIAGVFAYRIATNKFDVKFSIQSYEKYIYYLKDGWYIFTSRVATQLYQSMNIIILGFFVSDTLVGYYSIVIKIIRAIGNILSVIPNATYPFLVKTYKNSVELFYKRNIQLSVLLLAIMIIISSVVFYFSNDIIALVSGLENPPERMVNLLKIYTPLLLISAYGGLFTNSLIILDETKLLNKIVIVTGILNLIIAPIAIYFYEVEGLAWCTLFIIAVILILPKAYYILVKFKRRDLT